MGSFFRNWGGIVAHGCAVLRGVGVEAGRGARVNGFDFRPGA